MSEDPKGFNAGDYNLFRYVHNDPEDLTDPMGLDGADPHYLNFKEKQLAKITFDYQKLITATGSHIPRWTTVSSVTFTTSGNYSNPDPKSHYQTNLTVKDKITGKDKPAAGRTDTFVAVIPITSRALNADLHVDWWLNPKAAENDANLAGLEKQHTFGVEGGGDKVKGLLEKGGYWDKVQQQYSGGYRHPSILPAKIAAAVLASELRIGLDLAKAAQIMAWDQPGGTHDYPSF